jgi:hypothetical protein
VPDRNVAFLGRMSPGRLDGQLSRLRRTKLDALTSVE